MDVSQATLGGGFASPKKRFNHHLRLIRNQGMAKKRSGNISLTKTFDRSAEIIYLIGDDFRIRYANPACATWIGIEADQLVGAKCVFSSESESVVAGLCPPPDLFETTESRRSQIHEFLISVRLRAGSQRYLSANRPCISNQRSGRNVYFDSGCRHGITPQRVDVHRVILGGGRHAIASCTG